MYDDPELIRSVGKRIYFNKREIAEVREGAAITGKEPGTFVRDSALVISRFVSRMRQVGQSQEAALAELQRRLGNDFRYMLA